MFRVIILAILLVLFIASNASANKIITQNTDIGWITVINNSYITSEYINNTFLASSSFTTDLSNESTSISSTSFNWNISKAPTGDLFIGQLYPAGQTRFRINLSLGKYTSEALNPYINIYEGQLFNIEVIRLNTYYKVILNYYNESNIYRQDKYFISNSPYVDLLIDFYPNGTAVLYNGFDISTSFSTKYRLANKYPYSDISCNLIKLSAGLNGGHILNVSIYNFEQKIPEKLITIMPDNTTFAFGFDGPRVNYSNGTDWLKGHGQRATLWVSPRAYYNLLSSSQKSDVQDLINNKGFELGIHFVRSLRNLPWDAAVNEMDTETIKVSNIFNNRSVLSWVSLGNQENSSHAEYMWNNHHSLWRNAPNSNAGAYSGIYSIYSSSSVSSYSNIRFWDIASQYKSFNPAYTHSVLNLLEEPDSVNTSDFDRIFTNYTKSGIKIIPYSEWYYTNLNTITNITNIYFSQTSSHFNINTSNYNATTRIYDPNGKGIWFADGGTVITTIDNTNETDLIIKTPLNLTVKKLNTTITVSSDKIRVNVAVWNTTGEYYKKWNESSLNSSVMVSHTIGDFPPDAVIQVKRNGVQWNNYTSNSTGYISFTHSGYSEVQFEAATTGQTAFLAGFEVTLAFAAFLVVYLFGRKRR